jgi:predicted Ser/Thr protein kinase
MVQCPKCSAQNPQGSRFCNSCAEPLSSLSQMPTEEMPVSESQRAPADSPRVGRVISSDSVPVGGFTPGTILADRYRVIGLLGRGGMGEVYRADDLKLGQAVALKFLPPKLAEDSVRRERFFAEVRITRQLSHPNICRVYDIQEIDGRHFLSMEYIDGEDLASLIKRIGHLTNEKALDIARQLAAGLAAAHERGVLHRDLKPANIMLDGHGRVRITDFGLAIAAEDEAQAAEIAGTPAYMAPEQLAGKGATVRSDMYSLGLVLYEIYTGKKAFTGTTLAELREQKETHTPRAISEIREGMDPVVERLIRRCMERDPNARPSSVAQLALALPGGDPLAAALAAGETPSPEMVAASGSKEGLRPAVAWGLLAFIILGTLAIMAMNDRFMLHRRISFRKSPEMLAERSREILKKLGYTEDVADSAYGFSVDTANLNRIESLDKTSRRWENSGVSIFFWYRQSPRPLEVAITAIGANISNANPPFRFSGEVLVYLTTEGRLVGLRAMPPQVQSPGGTVQAPDWSVLFDEAGLDGSQWKPTDAQWSPLYYADARAAWEGSLPSMPNVRVRMEAAAFQGRPVNVEFKNQWSRPSRVEPYQLPMRQRISTGIFVLVLVSLIWGGIFFARRNLRLGRGDRRNANRLAFLSMSLFMMMFILDWHHVPTIYELVPIVLFAGFSLFLAGLFWIFYIAIEPFVRRRWPHFLASWTRLLSGDWRDPLVARDVLAGCALGVLISCIILFACKIVPLWLGHAEITRPTTFEFISARGISFFVSVFLAQILKAIFAGLLAICLFSLLRILLRSQIIAVAACILVLALLGEPQNFWHFAVLLLADTLLFLAMIRLGLMVVVFGFLTALIFTSYPVTLDASAWYASAGFAALGIFAAIVLYAFRTSLGGRPLLAPSHLDD